MEWRHTLEILTKDIQDIEKLVGNLQNSAASPSIDLDLALSKLRNVYEVLTMIKEDQMEEKRAMYAAAKAESAQKPPPAPATEPGSESEPPAPPIDKPHPVAEHHKESPAAPEAGNSASEPGPAAAEDSGPATQESTVPGKEDTGTTGKEDTGTTGKAILAERFSAASSINDNLAGKRPEGTETKLAGKPIDNIHRNIGINDRFLIIRELFKGDSDSFRDLINELDKAGDLQNARALLQQRFPDTTEHEGLDILHGLIKRRFTTV